MKGKNGSGGEDLGISTTIIIIIATVSGGIFFVLVGGTIVLVYLKKKREKLSEVKNLKQGSDNELENNPGPNQKANLADDEDQKIWEAKFNEYLKSKFGTTEITPTMIFANKL